MLQLLLASTIIIIYPSWLFILAALAKDASVANINLVVDRSRRTYGKPWSFVSLKNFVFFFNCLNSAGDVGLFPGAINCIGANTSGLTLTPTY